MLNNKSTQSSTTTRFQEVLLKQKINVTMPDDFLLKVKYLCRAIPEVEWSGILFYEVKGSIREPESMEVVLKDILPMDKGTGTFTSYNLDKRFVDYLMDNPEAMMWKVGHIHSHNTMGVFFSGTDMDELHDNSPNYDFYLSLIVNNFMDFQAKIATIGHAKVETIVAQYTATDEEGKPYSIDEGKFFVNVKRMYTYDCEIVSSTEQIDAPDYFKKGVENIMKPTPTVPAVNKTWSKGNGWQKSKKKKPKKFVQKPFVGTNKTPEEKLEEQYEEFADFYCETMFPEMSETELFTMGLFNLSGIMTLSDTVESILDGIPSLEMSDHEVAMNIVDTCVDVYAKFFPDRDVEEFALDIMETIAMLEELSEEYDYLPTTIESLNVIIKGIEENERSTTIQ